MRVPASSVRGPARRRLEQAAGRGLEGAELSLDGEAAGRYAGGPMWWVEFFSREAIICFVGAVLAPSRTTNGPKLAATWATKSSPPARKRKAA